MVYFGSVVFFRQFHLTQQISAELWRLARTIFKLVQGQQSVNHATVETVRSLKAKRIRIVFVVFLPHA